VVFTGSELSAPVRQQSLRLLPFVVIPNERREEERFSIARFSRDESLFVRLVFGHFARSSSEAVEPGRIFHQDEL
jgi:hypothetical protein